MSTVPLNTSFTSTGKWKIYALLDEEGAVRYVGITKNSLESRLTGHIKSSRRHDTHRDRWIRSMKSVPRIILIEETDDSSRERMWIFRHRAWGCRMTNLTDGGDGISGYIHTEEDRIKMSISQKGKSKPLESRENYANAAKRRWEDSKQRERLRSALMGHEVSEESKKKIGEARKNLILKGWVHPCTGKKHSDERKLKNSEAQLKKYASGYVSPRKGFIVSQETRDKLKAAHAARRAKIQQGSPS